MAGNLLIWLKTPFGEEILFSLLLPLISSVLILWGLSKAFKFKRNSFLTALLISSFYVVLNFLIRLNSLILNLADTQKPFVNAIGIIVSTIVLIALIINIYKANWWKTIICWLSVVYGKLLLIGIFTLLMLLYVPVFSESDSAPIVKAGITNFIIGDKGSEIGDNHFRVYRSELVSPTGIFAINLDSSVAFNSSVEGVSMDMECSSQNVKIVNSLKDGGERYEFASDSNSNLDNRIFKTGYAFFDCDEVCTKEKTTFNLRNLISKEGEYVTVSKIAEMNTGKLFGTKVLYVERERPIGINVDFALIGEDNATIDCEVTVTSENPSQTMKKSFIIDYIAD
jgi:hypothetical protein